MRETVIAEPGVKVDTMYFRESAGKNALHSCTAAACPCPWLSAISNSGSWLVTEFSLLSKTTFVLGWAAALVISSPEFCAGVDTHCCTSVVTSMKTKVLGVVIGTLMANGAAVVGRVLYVTPFSVQGLVTSRRSIPPAADT